jgi:predicted nucleic acid-binding protein
MTLFLDACAIIYLIEAESAFHAEVRQRMRSLREQFPDARLAISRLSILECLVKPLRDGDSALVGEYRAFFAAADLLTVELTPEVVEIALRLRAEHRLRTPDSLQAGCALALAASNRRFLTNDQGFTRVPGLEPILL